MQLKEPTSPHQTPSISGSTLFLRGSELLRSVHAAHQSELRFDRSVRTSLLFGRTGRLQPVASERGCPHRLQRVVQEVQRVCVIRCLDRNSDLQEWLNANASDQSDGYSRMHSCAPYVAILKKVLVNEQVPDTKRRSFRVCSDV